MTGTQFPAVTPAKQHLLPSWASKDYKGQEICDIPPWGHWMVSVACCQVNKGWDCIRKGVSVVVTNVKYKFYKIETEVI